MDGKLQATLILVAVLIAIALRLYIHLMTKRAASRQQTESDFSVNGEFRMREQVNINSPFPIRRNQGFFLNPNRTRVGATPPPEYVKYAPPSYDDYLKAQAYQSEKSASDADAVDDDIVRVHTMCLTTTTNDAVIVMPDQNHPHSCVLHI